MYNRILKSQNVIISGPALELPQPTTPAGTLRIGLPSMDDTTEAADWEQPSDDELLQSAEVQAQKIVEQATAQAQQIIADATERATAQRTGLLHKASEEIEALKQKSYAQGCKQAIDAKAGELEESMVTLSSTVSQLQQQIDSYMEEYQQMLPQLATAIAEKILTKRIQTDELEMVEMVQTAINSVRSSDWIGVTISDQMIELMNYFENHLAASTNYTVKPEFIPKDLPLGTCIIETEGGLVDASVSEQLKNAQQQLERAENS